MKTEIIFYFLRNRNYNNRLSGCVGCSTWVAVDDYGVDVAFELGDDCFEGVADSIPAWCKTRGYDCVVHVENKPRFIDWEGKEVFSSEDEYLEHKEFKQIECEFK